MERAIKNDTSGEFKHLLVALAQVIIAYPPNESNK